MPGPLSFMTDAEHQMYALGIPVSQLAVLIGRPVSGLASIASKLGMDVTAFIGVYLIRSDLYDKVVKELKKIILHES